MSMQDGLVNECHDNCQHAYSVDSVMATEPGKGDLGDSAQWKK